MAPKRMAKGRSAAGKKRSAADAINHSYSVKPSKRAQSEPKAKVNKPPFSGNRSASEGDIPRRQPPTPRSSFRKSPGKTPFELKRSVRFNSDVESSDGKISPVSPATSLFHPARQYRHRGTGGFGMLNSNSDAKGSSSQEREPKLGDNESKSTRKGEQQPSRSEENYKMPAKRPETIQEVGAAIKGLKQELREYAHETFGFELNHAQKSCFSLSAMAEKNPHLMLYVNYITDASKYGWERLFTDREQRCHLASALVGKVMETHILDHTFFGASESTLDRAHEIDSEQINGDGNQRLFGRNVSA